MDSPINSYKRLADIDNIKEIAYNTLFEKYIIENLRGDDKKLEIDSTDQESLMIKKNGGFPLPGFIYTFMYPPRVGEQKLDAGPYSKEYIDYVPLLFCTGVLKEHFQGINLNMLPNLERVKFLEVYYQAYKSFFKKIEVKTQNDKLALNKAFIRAASGIQAQNIISVMSQKAGANFPYAFRKYNMKNVRILRMIEYTEWDYIPFYDPKHAFKLLNQKNIHNIYWKTR